MKITELLGCARFLSVLVSSVVVLSACAKAGPKDNVLNMGFEAKAPDSVDLCPRFAGLMNYNGKTTEELFALRAKNVGLHPELLTGGYKPNPSVFQIDGKSPWWSLKGYLFRARGVNFIDGVSRESPFFGNPFLLVCPEWTADTVHWSDQRFSNPQSFADVYPVFLQPIGLKVFPKEKREEIVYDAMSYYNNARTLQDVNVNWAISDMGFDLNGYNAEDFGFNYLYVDPTGCNNLGKLPPEVMKIDQVLMVRHKDSCAPSCNDIYSPDGMRGFKLKNLPAKCHLLLWRKKPASHLVPPEFTVDIVFK